MAFEFAQLAGPLGGILAIAWGSGAAMGYGFASRTLGKRIDELKSEQKADQDRCDRAITDLSSRLREIEDRTFNGMERQLLQSRASAVGFVERGVPPMTAAPTASEKTRDRTDLPHG